MLIEGIIKICKDNQERNKNEHLKDRCKNCVFWKSTEGCAFYNRPIDWRLNEQNE